jgi:hypothetical protein
MQDPGNKRRRVLAAAAATLIIFGAMLLSAGTAGANARVTNFARIKFSDAAGQVTLKLPTACDSCTWMLSVNEPEAPGQPVVGTAIGTVDTNSGVLTVAYPSGFCGVIQADAFLGPAPSWDLRVGHKQTIQMDPCTTTTTTTTSTSTTTTTTSTTTTVAPTTTTSSTLAPVTKATSQLPFSNSASSSTTTTSPVVVAAVSGTPGGTATSPTPATLPFTGLDVKPLALIGTALILLGLLILSTLEQRRRALRRVSAAVRTTPDHASRASRWFLGE